MTLTELREALTDAATGTESVSVFFDYNKGASIVLDKDYPLVWWDIVGMEGTKPIRSTQPKSFITLNVWAAKQFNPDDDKIPEWDSVMADLEEYLLSVETQEFISVDLTDVTFELFPTGFFSVDREIAVRYRVRLTLWC